VSRAFPSCTRSILTEIYLCRACSYHETEDGNARTGESDDKVAELVGQLDILVGAPSTTC
jgi:hypothetical protein